MARTARAGRWAVASFASDLTSPMKTFWRRLRFGLSTLLGFKTRGFFIPYRYADTVAPLDYPALLPLFRGRATPVPRPSLRISRPFRQSRRDRKGRTSSPFRSGLVSPARRRCCLCDRPNTSAPADRRDRVRPLDPVHGPRRPGRCTADGNHLYRSGPAGRLVPSCGHAPACPSADADPAIFAGIQSGDVLFIDSSHIAMPGTDVDRLFLDILPRLAAGTLVHIHDITLPYAYPATWNWRGYNEQLIVGALLQGGGYELVFASHYVARHLLSGAKPEILSRVPLHSGAHETSLWLRKR